MPQQHMGFLPRQDFQILLTVLMDSGYQCVGPTQSEQSIRFLPVESVTQLVQGILDEQQPASYRLHPTRGPKQFTFTHTDQGIKPWVFPAREYICLATRNETGKLEFHSTVLTDRPIAYLGARACDLAALQLMDRHFMEHDGGDAAYTQRRQSLLIIGVNCQRSAATCFCVSSGDGPEITRGHDILLDELDGGFIVSANSEAGRKVTDKLPLQTVLREQVDTAAALVAQAAQQQTRSLPADIASTLKAKPDDKHWDDVAARCLSCGNCSMVCPTCFCHAQLDEADLDGQSSHRYRQWDSCFTQGHSYIHGITIRSGTRERYRQWLTHKLAYWHDQYGRSGCVGCGRCISWCPVGIDITAECASLTGDGVK